MSRKVVYVHGFAYAAFILDLVDKEIDHEAQGMYEWVKLIQ